MNDLAIDVTSLHKQFGEKPALRGIDLRVRQGEMVALLGASGSGKSTLLRHLSGLHVANRGAVKVLGRELQSNGRLSPHVRALRAEIATIFQQFNLVERLPVMTNVMAGALHRLPLWRTVVRSFPAAERERAHEALCRVGIEACAWQRASTLSGGQQQRAAISRALVQGARLVLADEPIASLDPSSSRRVMELLAAVNRDVGATVVVSLHQVDYAFAYCPRTVALRGGEVVFDGPTNQLSMERLQSLYGGQIDELFPEPAHSRPATRLPERDTAPLMQAA